MVLVGAAGLGPVLGCEGEPAPEPKPEPALQPPPAPAPARPPPEPKPQEPAAEPSEIAAQHILIAYRGAKAAPPEVRRSRAQAQKLAEEVLGKARGAEDFTKLVAQYSEDLGSKDRMGSLGKFTRDKMVKPFSDAAFKLQVNGISDVVQSDFGFHIIKRKQ
jgi:parvulin-like peptidyl-prolyl isomerase